MESAPRRLKDRQFQRRKARQRPVLFLEPLEDRTLLAAWTAVGPAPLATPGYPVSGNAVSGRVAGIAADPSNANIVYIASAGGGVWETTDAENANPTWKPLTDNVPGTTDSMGAIALAPSNPSVIYAGTGEANNSLDSNYGAGILVSTDGGSSWTLDNPSSIFTGLTVSAIAVNPTNPDNAYAAMGNVGANQAYISGAGIYETIDGGLTWTNTTASITTTDSFSDVVINPSTPSTLYAAVGYPFGDTPNGIYESTDSGTTWSLLSNFPNGTSVGRISLAISASNPQVIYAAASNPSNFELAELEVSTNGGSTWTDLPNTPNFPTTPGQSSGQGYYDLAVAVDPTNSSIVYVGGSAEPVGSGYVGAIYESTDGGTSWTNLGTDDNGVGTHADIHSLAFDANNNLLVGSDGGIFRKDSDPSNSSGFLWTNLNGDLNTIQFYDASLNPSNGNVLGGAQDNGVALYTANNGAWTMTNGGDGGNVYASGTMAYMDAPVASYGSSFFQVSNNGGQTWTTETSGLNSNDTMNFYAPFSVDPNNNQVVYLGTNEIYETTNGASSWTKLTSIGNNGWNPKGNAVDTIALAASDSDTIYASTGGNFASSSQIFVSTDGGTTWTEHDLPSGSGRVNQIVVDPNDAQTAYAVVSTFGGGRVFETTNGGLSWTDISGNLPNVPTWSIQVDAVNNILYVGNDEGVFSSSDGGVTWNPFGTGLPNAQVFSLDYSPTLDLLLAGTHGRGAWEIVTTSVTPVVTTNPTSQTVTAGGTATFTAAATGTPNPTVQWQVSTDGGTTFKNISGATSTTLTLTNVQTTQNGDEYQAVFTNAAGSVTTTAATLTVQFAPIVTTQPLSQSITVDQPVTFTAAANGGPAPTVQWQVSTNDGSSFTNISGATSTTLTIPNVPAADNGFEYRAVFTNSVGTATTKSALLTVMPYPVTTTASKASATYSPNAQTLMLSANVADTSNPKNVVNEGTVLFTVEQGGSPIGSASGAVSGGQASASVSLPAGLAVGGYTIAVSYSDSLGYYADGGDTNATLTIGPANVATTAANASAFFNPSSQSVTLSATVADTSIKTDTVDEGTVTFTITQGSTTIGTASGTVSGGNVSATFSVLAGQIVGSYAIAVSYSDSLGNFVDNGNTNAALTISSTNVTTTAAGLSPIYSPNAQALTFSASVATASSDPVDEGTVTFTVTQGSTSLGTALGKVSGGQASADYILPAGQGVGNYTIAVSYNDNLGNYLDGGDNTPSAITVTQANVTTTAVNASTLYTLSEQSLALSANLADTSVSSDTVTHGTVTFTVKEGNTTIGTATGTVSNGVASANLSLPAEQAVGNYSIVVAYSDSQSNFIDSGDTNAALTITPAEVTTTAAAVATTFSTPAQMVTLSAAVANDSVPSDLVNEGVVTFTIYRGSTAIGSVGAAVNGGKASAGFSLPAGQSAGNYTIAVSYSDSRGNFTDTGDIGSSLAIGTVATNVLLTGASLAPNLFAANVTETLTAHVSSSNSTRVAQGAVTFVLSSLSVSANVDANGNASVSLTLPMLGLFAPQAVQLIYSDPANDLTVSTSTRTLPWDSINALLPSTATVAPSGLTVSSNVPGLGLFSLAYNLDGLLTEIEFGLLSLLYSYNSANQLIQLSLNGMPLALVP